MRYQRLFRRAAGRFTGFDEYESIFVADNHPVIPNARRGFLSGAKPTQLSTRIAQPTTSSLPASPDIISNFLSYAKADVGC